MWSRLTGNYSGLSQSDEDGRTSPNVGRLYDDSIMLFGEDGHPVLGPLPRDRPHQLKVRGVYSTKRDPRFLTADAFQAPRAIRPMAKWSF